MNHCFINCLIIIIGTAILNADAYAYDHNNSSSNPEIRVLQTRYGEHDNFSRIVLDLNKRTKYKILKISDKSYDIELFGYQGEEIEDYYPRDNDHIEKIQYSKLNNKLIVHIILKRPSYVLKDFRLTETDRIVIDFSDAPDRSRLNGVIKSENTKSLEIT